MPIDLSPLRGVHTEVTTELLSQWLASELGDLPAWLIIAKALSQSECFALSLYVADASDSKYITARLRNAPQSGRFKIRLASHQFQMSRLYDDIDFNVAAPPWGDGSVIAAINAVHGYFCTGVSAYGSA